MTEPNPSDPVTVPRPGSALAVGQPAARRVRRRRLVLVAIAVALATAIGLGFFHRDIDAPAAVAIADRLMGQYRKVSGEPMQLFGAREGRIWADGWEFRWRYAPCPQLASLRVWISRDGRRARYAELPDCTPDNGSGADPLKV